MSEQRYDVVVIGAGSAGIGAALGAAKNGAKTLLIDQSGFPGGDLVSGLPVYGCCNSLGQWIVGGVVKELVAGCEALGGYVGCLFDWRTTWAVCLDPEVLKLVLAESIAQHHVSLLLNSMVHDVVARAGQVERIAVINKSGPALISADVFVDATGDGDVAVLAGAEYEKGGPSGELQPASLVFRMSGVNAPALLEYVGDNQEDFVLAENAVIGKSRAECAREVQRSGYPLAVVSAGGPLLGDAIRSGEMYPCAGLFISPTSTARHEVGINATRLAGVDGTNSEQASIALTTLAGQVRTCMSFLQRRVPGFPDAVLSAIAWRLGIRETRRIVGDYVLSTADLLEAKKSDEGIAKAGHHLDVHGSGTFQRRIPISRGGSCDIPYGCLVPRGLDNVLVAGRCLSSTREANGSARVMGTCLATGQAAGLAAAMCSANHWQSVRDVPVSQLRDALKSQGCVVDGTE